MVGENVITVRVTVRQRFWVGPVIQALAWFLTEFELILTDRERDWVMKTSVAAIARWGMVPQFEQVVA